MLKLLDMDVGFFGEEPSVTIIDFNRSGGLLKKAADSRVESFVSQITPEEGKIYVHILAMGAGEYYGANRNADYFPEDNLVKCHETFSTSPAHIFKHHINKNPEIAMGKVIFSVYNERMHRVEVIAWVDKAKGWDYVERIEKGEFPSTSMACHTPFDTCSICGNKARTRQQYCDHLKNDLGKIMPDGKKVMAINDGPLRFFDMSFVFKPADITSRVLQKVAYSKNQEPAFSSIDNAEENGLLDKTAGIKKLSELIKEIEGEVVASSPSLEAILKKVQDPDDDVLKTLTHFDLHHVILALSELGISPSVGFFAKLIGQKLSGESVSGVEYLVQGLLKEDASNVNVPIMNMEKSAGDSEVGYLVRTLSPITKQASLFPAPVMERSSGYPESHLFPMPYGYASSGNMGYIGNGPEVIPDPRDAYLSLKNSKGSDSPGLLKTLFLIGGAAVAAKWLLSRMIESKMREVANQKQHPPVKIVLVKSASEAFSTQKLVKAALLRDLTQNFNNQ